MPRRTGSSQRWRQRQERDIYVEQASREGWRSRAVFKLEQIQAKEKLLNRGMVCVDLGSAPGGFSQLAAKLVGPTGRVIAIDLLPMEPIPGVEFLQGDFMAPETLEALRNLVGPNPVELVMSDMAPNISGNRTIDQARSLALLDEALSFAREVLRPGGDFLVKAFQGEGIDAFTRDLKREFRTVKTLKPKASRPESREIYLLARRFGM
ncbi:MAG TPA: RlmE family RNA methyltransferase [Gammaproteobacteria bacterium]|nr:RlmE family RNA methyltransferase [Gammaproteobacteria bacterium]